MSADVWEQAIKTWEQFTDLVEHRNRNRTKNSPAEEKDRKKDNASIHGACEKPSSGGCLVSSLGTRTVCTNIALGSGVETLLGKQLLFSGYFVHPNRLGRVHSS
jgi:hypothetical protein